MRYFRASRQPNSRNWVAYRPENTSLIVYSLLFFLQSSLRMFSLCRMRRKRRPALPMACRRPLHFLPSLAAAAAAAGAYLQKRSFATANDHFCNLALAGDGAKALCPALAQDSFLFRSGPSPYESVILAPISRLNGFLALVVGLGDGEWIGYQRKQKLAQQSPNNLGSAGTQIPRI